MAKAKKTLANIKHPNSRKAHAMTKEIIRNKTTKTKIKFNQLVKKSLVADKLEFFKHMVVNSENVCTPSDLSKFVEQIYLTRFDAERKELEARNSRYKNTNNTGTRTGRLDAIKMTQEKERNEFKYHGMEMPDLLDPDQLTLLKEWEGDVDSIPKFTLKKYKCSELHELQVELDKKTDANE